MRRDEGPNKNVYGPRAPPVSTHSPSMQREARSWQTSATKPFLQPRPGLLMLFLSSAPPKKGLPYLQLCGSWNSLELLAHGPISEG